MQYTVPHYYRQFHCIADKCPDTCCSGWQIQIDRVSLKKYRKKKGALGNRLKNEINWKESCFRQYDGRCAFLNERNLCDLYLEGGGESAFCRTCRTYPRHIEEFEGLREISLSLSCPAAAGLILNCRDSVRFLHTDIPGHEENFDDFDFFLFTKLADTRNLIFRILQNRSLSFPLRTAMVLSLSHDFQERIRKNALYDTESLLERYSSENAAPWFHARLTGLKLSGEWEKKRKDTLEKIFSIFDHFEVLRGDWTSFLDNVRSILKNAPSSGRKTERRFCGLFSDIISEQLLIYFIYTYFCGAVYNGNAYAKIKFSVTGMILIRELVRAQWLTNPAADVSVIIKTACRFAREVEHSDHNKLTMERILSNEKMFGLEELFSLL